MVMPGVDAQYVNYIPEPGTLALLGLAVIFLRRR
jgi:hypothetical protein